MRAALYALCCLLQGAAARSPAARTKASKPNIVWFLTDDQDQMLGSSFPTHGATPMPKTQALMADMGTTATNFFVHTPICNPSRSELLSGRYFHNIKAVNVPLWSMHVDEPKVNNATFARYLKEEAGYTVGMFGKYQNTVPDPAPPGFDAWLANGGGTYIAPMFAAQGMEYFGLADGRWHGTSDNYTTATVGNTSIAWIKKVVHEDPTRPFFAYVAPKAAHEPFNPAPWYEGHWDDSWPSSEPRDNPAWNCTAAARQNHNGVVPTQPMIDATTAEVISDIFKNRWRTLMSVDDVIADVIQTCEDLGVADNTYFFYSSDHGFQLGEFNIPMDKRHVFDWDTRVHLLARGPGIKHGSTWAQPATQVDLAPTFLGIAGLAAPSQMDGKSLLPLLVNTGDAASVAEISAPTLNHLRTLGGNSEAYTKGWRDLVFIEYYWVNDNDKCDAKCAGPQNSYPRSDANCGDLTPGANAHCWSSPNLTSGPHCDSGCYATESIANNFIALRTMPESKWGNMLYAEYELGQQRVKNIDFKFVGFRSLYNMTSDPWSMHNLINNTHGMLETAAISAMANELHILLHTWFGCEGDACP